ncbi:MAG: GGDEF domain-containing protein [Enterocloster bolteae]
MIDDTEAQNQKQEYWEKSMRDSLTGLFNRDAAVQSVNRYMQDGSRAPEGTLMVIDLDNFKEINDTKGHLFGDSVLTEAARCIAGVFDSQDMVGRIGGDEFLVFSKQLSGREEIMKRGRQLIEDIAGLPSVKKSGSKLSCSIGAAVYPADGSTYEQLFLKADMALYAGKNWGKGRCVVYDSS